MTEIYDYYEKHIHRVAEVICLNCFSRWIAVYPERVLLKDLYCDECCKTGFIIETGQILEN